VEEESAMEHEERRLERALEHATDISKRDFVVNGAGVSCWRYTPEPRGRYPYLTGFVQAKCMTSPEETNKGFIAEFGGRGEDVEDFYEMVAGVKRVE
jgi:hypothetical protein